MVPETTEVSEAAKTRRCECRIQREPILGETPMLFWTIWGLVNILLILRWARLDRYS